MLGGLSESGEYHCNDLTYLFVRTAKELGLPDPKILLRCSKDMPQNLLGKGIECIASGIGAPLLSNDDVVIPAMMQAGIRQNLHITMLRQHAGSLLSLEKVAIRITVLF